MPSREMVTLHFTEAAVAYPKGLERKVLIPWPLSLCSRSTCPSCGIRTVPSPNRHLPPSHPPSVFDSFSHESKCAHRCCFVENLSCTLFASCQVLTHWCYPIPRAHYSSRDSACLACCRGLAPCIPGLINSSIREPWTQSNTGQKELSKFHMFISSSQFIFYFS